MLPISLRLAAVVLAPLTAPALADGSDALGTPSIPFAPSGDVLLAGTGLVEGQPGSITVEVPLDATVQQVVAYWEGLDEPGLSQGDTDTVTLSGFEVTGQRIGGPTNIVQQYWVSGYRADLTALGLVQPGENLVTVSGLDFTYANNGLALVVVLEDEQQSLEVRDGVDYAYAGFSGELRVTAPVVYDLEPADVARAATVDLLVAGVAADRPSVIEVRVDGQLVREEIDVLGNLLGAELDALSLELEIPAGAVQVSVQLISEDRGGPLTGLLEASMSWLYAGLTVNQAVETFHGCDPHDWLCNWYRWDPWNTDDNVTQYDFKDRFNETFGVSPWRSGIWNHKNLGSALVGSGWNFWRRWLNREAVAALLNSDSMNYPYDTDEVIALYQDAVGQIDAGKSFFEVLQLFHEANRLGCPEGF